MGCCNCILNKLELGRREASSCWDNGCQNDCRCVSEASFLTQVSSEYLGDAPFGVKTTRICENAEFQRPFRGESDESPI